MCHTIFSEMKRNMSVIYYKVNPGGNLTAIVQGEFPKDERLKICERILAEDPSIEQVGFWVQPTTAQAKAKLEMAGGEFCGNATRSLGAVLHLHTNETHFQLESSGFTDLIDLDVSISHAQISLPHTSFNLQLETKLCTLPGISHLITEEKIDKESTLRLLQQHNLATEKAAGVMSYTEQDGKYAMRPIVWVRDAETLYEETACASGTLALAFYLHHTKGEKKFSIVQPSGSVFEVELRDHLLILSGPIHEVAKKEISL